MRISTSKVAAAVGGQFRVFIWPTITHEHTHFHIKDITTQQNVMLANHVNLKKDARSEGACLDNICGESASFQQNVDESAIKRMNSCLPSVSAREIERHTSLSMASPDLPLQKTSHKLSPDLPNTWGLKKQAQTCILALYKRRVAFWRSFFRRLMWDKISRWDSPVYSLIFYMEIRTLK